MGFAMGEVFDILVDDYYEIGPNNPYGSPALWEIGIRFYAGQWICEYRRYLRKRHAVHSEVRRRFHRIQTDLNSVSVAQKKGCQTFILGFPLTFRLKSSKIASNV